MVIVRLTDGIGNQLFQYAAGRALAHRNNAPLQLDISSYASDKRRAYRLDHFNIAASVASRRKVAYLTGRGLEGARRRRVSDFIRTYLPGCRYVVLQEKNYTFDPTVLQQRGRIYLIGYWQSPKYFQGMEAMLRQELSVKGQPDPANRELVDLSSQVESVSLHVRRGDYVSDPRASQEHGLCPLDYYEAAISALAAMVERPHLFVFSDDVAWTQQNIRLGYPATYVTHNGVARDYEDLRLMSCCKHHIIANSTFSWWGAWLSPNPQKIVIAPQQWFNGTDLDTRDLIPDSWIRL